MADQPKTRTCGTMLVHDRLLRTRPEYVRARAASENNAHAFAQTGRLHARSGVTVIPAVVHVVFNQQSPEQNISDAQIKSQIDVLNRDYRKTNPDVASTPAPFLPLAADARVEFALAQKDPQGNPTNGITRTPTAAASFVDDDKVKAAATGGADPWPSDRYLNLWVCALGNSLLGYAQFPGGPAATDGVVILHSAFGNTGTAAPPFNLGRTATHEIGHWLNLRHIWGDDGNGCNGSDFVDDTPNQAGSNAGTPAFPHVTCNNGPNGDMFMNYMDYVDDNAMFMFTEGQVARMQASLDGERNTMGTPKVTATLKFQDDPNPGVTVKIRDVATVKFRDDIGPGTINVLDLGTLKFRDDMGTGTIKFRDDVKQPVLDKPPFQDFGNLAGSDLGNIFGGFDPQARGRAGASPFVLSTPHHSMAWMRSFPGAAQSTIASYEAQIREYEQQLEAYSQAEQTGALTLEETQTANALYQEYMALVDEYRQMTGS